MRDHDDFSGAESQGCFYGFCEPSSVFFGGGDAVLDDAHFAREAFDFPCLVGADDCAIEPHAEVALLLQKGEEIGRLGAVRDCDGEGDEDGFFSPGHQLLHNRTRRLRADGLAAFGAGGFGDAGEEQFKVVVHIGHRADGGASGFYVVGLLDGDGGRDAANLIDAGLVHAVEELPGVGRERLDVAALAFGIDGVEREGAFTRAAGAGDDDEFTQW